MSRKDRFPSNKPKTLIIIDKPINFIATIWSKHGGWIILGAILGILGSLPGWIYIVFK